MNNPVTFLRYGFFAFAFVVFSCLAGVAQEAQGELSDDEKTELFDKLANYLSETKWTGQFTVTGGDNDELTKEEYYILSAEKMKEGDYWKLVARIKYGENDTTLPLPLEIKWAGKTPVITVDKMAVPGIGVFDARVLIRNGKYSGTWSHNEVGGHLFGRDRKNDRGRVGRNERDSGQEKIGDVFDSQRN